MCEAKSEGLVNYPTTLAPVSGSVTVTAQCADNVTCNSNGGWSVQVSQCVCDKGYHETTLNGTHSCQGEGNILLVSSCSFPSTHSCS